MRRLTVITLALVLSACAQAPLTNPNQAANLQADSWACEKEVAQVLALRQQAIPQPRPAVPTSYRTTCDSYGSSTDCDTRVTNSRSHGDSFASSFAASQAAALPGQLRDSCMAAKGWVRAASR